MGSGENRLDPAWSSQDKRFRFLGYQWQSSGVEEGRLWAEAHRIVQLVSATGALPSGPLAQFPDLLLEFAHLAA